MERRNAIIFTLFTLVSLSVMTAASSAYRISVLSHDIERIIAEDLPLERAARELVAALADRPENGGVQAESTSIEDRLERVLALAADHDASEPDDVGSSVSALIASTSLRTRADGATDRDARAGDHSDHSDMEVAARSLLRAARARTNRDTVATANDEEASILWLGAVGFGCLCLGALLVRFALRLFAEVQILRVLVPVCSVCREVRNDPAFWRLVDGYLANSGSAKLAHGRCPRCEAVRAGAPG